MKEKAKAKGAILDEVRTALRGMAVAKALEISEKGKRIVVRIPEDIFISNKDFERIHKSLEKIGGSYVEGSKAWEIHGKKSG
jgi:hypothetical protein